MLLEPFLRRELATSIRSSRVFRDRRAAWLLTSLVALGSFGIWDQLGWDRSSVEGASRFGLASFGLAVAALASLGLPIVVPQVARTIASGQDSRSLDSLLASGFSSPEIVLGAMACGLFRYANAVAAGLPILVLLLVLGGVSWTWLALAGLVLGSSALLMAAFSVVVSVVMKSASKVVGTATGLFLLWIGMPATIVILRPLVWPDAPSWLTGLALGLADASPSGLLLDLAGLVPRSGGLVGAIARLVVCELVGSLVLVGWAMFRLRPAVRRRQAPKLESNRSRKLLAKLREPAPRPPCGDDPVLWYEMHSHGGVSAKAHYLGQAISLVMLLGVAIGLWSFAEPAFKELASRGYAPSVEAFTMPKVDPIARLLIKRGQTPTPMVFNASPGQARLEFNIVLREVSALFLMGFILVATGTAFETLKGEQRRDTWRILIATPLSGSEILQAKIGGTVWKIRDGAFALLGLWGIGLISGAVHPLGFLMASALLAATGAFFIAQGQAIALLSSHPEKVGPSLLMPMFVPVFAIVSLLLVAAPMILVWASLFTYEDFEAVFDAGPFPQFSDLNLAGAMGARAVGVACLCGTSILGLGAALLININARSFDESIGRSTSPRFRSVISSTAVIQARAVCDAMADV